MDGDGDGCWEGGGGREGKADEGVEAVESPPSLVLFFNLSTLEENLWAGAPKGKAGLAAAALAHPLELDVAPRMPLNPGKLG